MLSPASSQLLLSIMGEAKTGPQRIKGGVPAGWHYLHKTGTGQELGARSTGFNDIGIMTAATLDSTVPFYFKMSLHDGNHSRLDLTNDYSNGPVAISACPHIVAYLGDTLVAGIPPGH